MRAPLLCISSPVPDSGPLLIVVAEALWVAVLLNQRRVLSRRKPFLLCLRLKSAKQGCFHPRDVLPKQSTASPGFRMAARPLGPRITGDPRSARVTRAPTTAPLSPPSASNRAPAPVVWT